MILSGWFNIAVTAVLFATLVYVIVSYYRPGKNEDAGSSEQPKYRMLDDDDEGAARKNT